MWYQYKIADIHLTCEIPFEVTVSEESVEFFRTLPPEDRQVDFKVQFEPVEKMEQPTEGGHWEVCQYYVGDEREYRIYFYTAPQGEIYAKITWLRERPDLLQCFYQKGKESYLNYSLNICNILGLENILLMKRGLLLHASFVRWKQSGILFTAPSGTGKSTQAELWRMHEGAEIINGDRAALRRTNGIWKAYGLPYAGSSRIYRSESAPISVIIVLRQAKDNHIERLSVREAISYLLPELTVHRWEPEFVNRVMDILLDMLGQVPVYLLECRPEIEAVDLVKDVLMNECERSNKK